MLGPPTLADVLAQCREHHGDDQIDELSRALSRRGELGDRGAERALRRTATLASLRLDPITQIASALALLGVGLDGSEDPELEVQVGELLEGLGEGVDVEARVELEGLIEALGRLAAIHWDALDEESVESLRTMLVAMAADVRLTLLLLCDRLEVIRELELVADPATRQRIARETREVFAPLANRLGIRQLKWELEDRALQELEPEVYAEITAKLAAQPSERQRHIDGAVELLREVLDEVGLVAEVSGRRKHIYSIVKKMRRKQVRFEEIYDVDAVRVILEADDEVLGKRYCYMGLGLVHGLWAPISGEFDDYIARPKPNGYRSLHTAVIGLGGCPLEVQLRTRAMHELSEFGVAAHWAYKESTRDESESEPFDILRQLGDWQEGLVDPRELAEVLETNLFKDEVHVFGPGGDIIVLPEGATALDLAYRMRTCVGHRARAATVNGVMVSLNHTLATWDRVEILEKKQSEPSRDWLNPHLGYLNTSRARQKVRQWFRAQDRERAIGGGRETLERELLRAGIGGPGRPAQTELDELAVAHDFESGDEFLAAIGFGDFDAQGLAARLLERHLLEPAPSSARQDARDAAGVSVGGSSDVMSQPARCCSPAPGDDVVGWVSRGRGIMIHRRDCADIIHNPEPEWIIEIDWGRRRHHYPVKVSLDVIDRPGVLRDIAELVSNMGINMRATHSSRSEETAGTQTLTLELEIDEPTQALRALGRLEGLPAVLSARRIVG